MAQEWRDSIPVLHHAHLAAPHFSAHLDEIRSDVLCYEPVTPSVPLPMAAIRDHRQSYETATRPVRRDEG